MLLVVEVGAVVEVTLVAVVVVGTVVVRVAVVDVVVAILRRSRQTSKVAFLSERDLATTAWGGQSRQHGFPRLRPPPRSGCMSSSCNCSSAVSS